MNSHLVIPAVLLLALWLADKVMRPNAAQVERRRKRLENLYRLPAAKSSGGENSVIKNIALAGLVFFLIGRPAASAEDFSTTNSHKLARFWELVEAKQRPVRVLSFGDSVADSYRSPTYNFFEHLLTKFGAVGYSFHTYHNTLGINLTNVSGLTEPNEYWFNRHYTLPPDGAVWWEREWVPGGNRCDYVGLAYVAYPQGGTMTFSVSTNTGPQF